MGKVHCTVCKKRCRGAVLKIEDKYLHRECFKCVVCSTSLEKGGFYQRNNQFYCCDDYQATFGARCAVCSQYVLGEVVTVFGRTFHSGCFKCQDCGVSFHSGDRATLWEKRYLCSRCWHERESTTEKKTATSPPPDFRGVVNGATNGTHERDVTSSNLLTSTPKVTTAASSSTAVVTHHWMQQLHNTLTSDSEGTNSDFPFEAGVKHAGYPRTAYLPHSASSMGHHPVGHQHTGTASLVPSETPVPSAEKTMSLVGGYPGRAAHNLNVARRRHRSAGPYEPKYSYDYGRFYVQNYIQLASEGELSGAVSPRDKYRRSGMATPTRPPVATSSPHFHRPPDRPFSYRHPPTHVEKPKVTPTNHKRPPPSGSVSASRGGLSNGTGHPLHHHSARSRTPLAMNGASHHVLNKKLSSEKEVDEDDAFSATPLPPHPHSEAECPESVEPKRLALYPGGHEPKLGDQPPIERQDWPAPPSPAVMLIERFRQKCASLPPPSVRYRSMMSGIAATESIATDEARSEYSHTSTTTTGTTTDPPAPSSAPPPTSHHLPNGNLHSQHSAAVARRKLEMLNGYHHWNSDALPVASSLSVDESDSYKECKQRQVLNDVASSKSGIAQALLSELSKSRSRSPSPVLDPISASRAPGADMEPPFRPRYEKHTFASPSRDNRRDRMDMHSVASPMEYSYTGGRWRNMPSCPTSPRAGTLACLPGYIPNLPDAASPSLGISIPPQGSVSAQSILHSLRAASLPSRGLHNVTAASCYEMHRVPPDHHHHPHPLLLEGGSIPYEPGLETPHTEHSHSMATLSGVDSVGGHGFPPSEDYCAAMYNVQSWLRPSPFALLLPRSIYKPEPPPAKIYPYQTLVEGSPKELRGVDKSRKEDHLSEEEFLAVFQMTRDVFYQLPLWKQNDLKRRVRLY